MKGELRWASEFALLVTFPEQISVAASRGVVAAARAVKAAIQTGRITGIRDLHPGYCTLLIVLEPASADPERIATEVRRITAALDPEPPDEPGRTVEIPVCYDAALAPDLAEIAQRAGVDPATAARLHADPAYRVCFLGFTPGFPYLVGLPEALAMPRLPEPRRLVAAGSVAIAGSQAGIYPFATPGGWRLVGRTPLRLFDVDRDPAALLAPGDAVRFVPISLQEFRRQVSS